MATTNNSIDSFRAANLVYVATNGNDTTGNGSIYNPYLTISQALSSITDATTNKRYAIIIQSGQYNETTLVIKPWISLVGNGYNNTRITSGTNQVTLDASFSGVSARSGFFNLILTGTTGLNFDLSAMSAGSAVFDVWNSWINGTVTIIGRSAGNDFLQTFLSSYFAAVNLKSIQLSSVSNVYNSSFTITSASTNGNSVGGSTGDSFLTTLTVQSLSTNTTTLQAAGGIISSTLTVDGANAVYNPDASMYKVPTILNSGTVTLQSIANGVSANFTPNNYTPSDSSVKGNLSGIDTFLGAGSFPGNVLANTAGNGFRAKEGSNAKQGIATLSSGTIVVSNTSVTANSRIFLTPQDNNTVGSLRVSARTVSTSFTITSSSNTDSGVVAYEIFEPA